MAIETIKNAGAYNDVKQAGSIDIQPLATSRVHASGTPTEATRNVIFKEDSLDTSVNDVTGQASITQIRAAISEANYKATRTRCEFSVDEPTNRIAIKVIDKETDKVIREIPAEESLEMLAKIWELAGLLVDEKR